MVAFWLGVCAGLSAAAAQVILLDVMNLEEMSRMSVCSSVFLYQQA